MNSYKKLLKNSGIFAIANLGSKLISILLVPFYTYVLSTEQYGTVDMITTTVSLILPFITLSIFEATLRFSVKSEYDKGSIFSNSMFITIAGNLLFILFYPLLKKVSLLNGYIVIFYLMIFVQCINAVFSQFARGIGEIKVFAFNGILNTIITVTLNIVLLAKLNWGINGYFISILVANIICNIYLFVYLKFNKYINFKNYDKKLMREMIKYTVPLIPNALMWWIMNASDRYAVGLFLGVAFNGLYAVAYKVPTILNLLNTIFFQAWQLSAIEEGDSEHKSKFYTEVFNIFSIVMILGTSAILVVIKPVIRVAVSSEFSETWRYVPFLLVAVVFSSFSSFLGTNYVAMKKTNGAFKTSIIGAVINVVLNMVLIPLIGLNGAAIATMISFCVVWIARIYDTKEFVDIKIKVKKMIVMFLIVFIQIGMLYSNFKWLLIYEFIAFIILLFINRDLIIELLKIVKKVFNKKMTVSK